MKRITVVVVVLVALLIVPAQAPAAKKAGPPSGCTTQSYRYDSGGAPGSGPVNDPLFARQWALDQLHAPEAWARGARGAGTTVAVVDTGVDLSHPDLRSKLVGGHDFLAGRRDCPAGPQDENGHGTHVAGIAAAVTNNGIAWPAWRRTPASCPYGCSTRRAAGHSRTSRPASAGRPTSAPR